MRIVKVKKPSERTDWADVFRAFLASGEDTMEIIDWGANYKNIWSAYCTAKMALPVHGIEKAVSVTMRKGRIFLIRKEGAISDAE